jgi:hypothetical protein
MFTEVNLLIIITTNRVGYRLVRLEDNRIPDVQIVPEILFGLAKARLKLSQRRSLNLLSTTHHPPPPTTQTFKALPGIV